tara:strand:- start:58 stop:282 length:225 start_codon:yes stop_codon:yes gene_type:complete
MFRLFSPQMPKTTAFYADMIAAVVLFATVVIMTTMAFHAGTDTARLLAATTPLSLLFIGLMLSNGACLRAHHHS